MITDHPSAVPGVHQWSTPHLHQGRSSAGAVWDLWKPEMVIFTLVCKSPFLGNGVMICCNTHIYIYYIILYYIVLYYIILYYIVLYYIILYYIIYIIYIIYINLCI